MSADLSSSIAAAAKQRLGALGLVRKGRSRTWLDDHGWWLIHVEFQPSASGRFYLNIGEHHLFVRRDHFVLEDVERPLGGTWTGDQGGASIAKAVDAAADAIIARRARHGEARPALTRLRRSRNDLLAGIAAGLLGDDATARARLTGHVHPAYHPVAAEYLAALGDGGFDAVARSMTVETRAALRLPTATQFWDT